MKLYWLLPAFLPVFAACQQNGHKNFAPNNIAAGKPEQENHYQYVHEIPCPAGYERVPAADHSFNKWLADIKLKKDKTVHLYDGSLKINQEAQFAVMDITVGNKDLQQCADAVMRLRSEYLYSLGQFNAIRFYDNNNTCYACPANCNRACFEKYLEKVFSYCGTLSLQNQLPDAGSVQQIQAGDVIIQGGSPGHAVIVVDIAINKNGQKLYMIAQSYMPAQEIHILKNPEEEAISPWYRAESVDIQTPEWKFNKASLKKW